MKARLKISNIRNFRLLVLLLFVFCLAFVFSSNTYAAEGYFDYSQVKLTYYFARFNETSRVYDVVSSEYNTNASKLLLDSETGLYSYSFNITQPSGNINCNDKCWIYITKITITPRNLANPMTYPDSTVADYTHVYMYSVHDFIQGETKNIISNMSNFYMSPRGRDVWFPASNTSHNACEDQGSSDCNVTFFNNNVDLDPEFAYNGFIIDIDNNLFDNNHASLQNYGYLGVVQNPYNLDSHTFVHTSSLLYFIPPTSPIVFYGRIWQDDNPSSNIDPGEDLAETSPDFDLENQIINQNSQNAQDSASDLNIGFTVPWILQSWFNLFIDSSCASIPNMASMLHSPQSTVCSPWSSQIRSVTTPIFSMLASLLAFGFVIRWLSGREGKEIST